MRRAVYSKSEIQRRNVANAGRFNGGCVARLVNLEAVRACLETLREVRARQSHPIRSCAWTSSDRSFRCVVRSSRLWRKSDNDSFQDDECNGDLSPTEALKSAVRGANR